MKGDRFKIRDEGEERELMRKRVGCEEMDWKGKYRAVRKR